MKDDAGDVDKLRRLVAESGHKPKQELLHMSQRWQSLEHGSALVYLHTPDTPTKWGSFRSLLKLSKSESRHNGTCSSSGQSRHTSSDTPFFGGHGSLPFCVVDCPAPVLAEQLTLIEQELFQRCHPVHFLNSQYHGIGVSQSLPGLRTPTMSRKLETPNSTKRNLFVDDDTETESGVLPMIFHSQELAHWVSAEILSCGSLKSKSNLIVKFVTAAHLCCEFHNYASAISILDGLENVLIRQLPVWTTLPGKVAAYMEELVNIRMKLRSDSGWLTSVPGWHLHPLIPCSVLMALHVQQLEIGSFTLANGMLKWDKIRSISEVVDQLRIFRDHRYALEPNLCVQQGLHRCLQEYSSQDLHAVAASQEKNFPRNSSSLSATLRKVGRKLMANKN